MMTNALDIRPSPLAGRWYPANPERLAKSVDAYIKSAQLPALEGEIIGVVAPHAGHQYSGPVAGYAFATFKGLAPQLVVIVSPMHRPFHHPIVVSGHQAYETPLGVVEIHSEAVEAFTQTAESQFGISISAVRYDDEHSLEIEIPFLQRVLPDGFKILPLMVRDNSPIILQKIGQALGSVADKWKALFVASTDLSHFYPQNVAERLDREILARMESFDPIYFLHAEEEGVGFACGRAAVATVMWAAKELGANRIQVLHYATSGNVTGDYSQVVGYGAAVILRQSAPKEEKKSP
ncbi:MAG: AmmeMemoRadiSam system protein B [Anaerolineales bacterium]